jgi:hypothetical protein
MTAGLAVQATGNLDGLAIGPWAGPGVLAAWAAGALLAGGLLLRLRDARPPSGGRGRHHWWSGASQTSEFLLGLRRMNSLAAANDSGARRDFRPPAAGQIHKIQESVFRWAHEVT